MTGTLAGRTVAVTRPRDGAGALAARLRARGAEVLEVPLIRFAAPERDDAALEALRERPDWLLLTSPQAVTALLELLGRHGLDASALAGLKLAAVGSSTAGRLRERGLWAEYLPPTPGALALGAGLPARPGERALHLTSPVAEDDLARALAARGVAYRRAELYRTEPATPDAADLDRLRAADVVTLTSGSAARQLAALVGRAGRVAVLGPQTARAARAAGFTRITLAAPVTLEGLADAAARALGSEADNPDAVAPL